MKYFRKDWILYQEIVTEGGKKPDVLLDIKENEGDVETNKHVPFIEETKDGYSVRSGKNDFHATDNEHHTMFIELRIDDKFSYRKIIDINEKPEATFNVPKGKKVEAFAFCNLHGMFKYSL